MPTLLATDSFAPAWTPDGTRASIKGLNSDYKNIIATIESIKDTLVSAGWVQTESIKASGNIAMAGYFNQQFIIRINEFALFNGVGGTPLTLVEIAAQLTANTNYNVNLVWAVDPEGTILKADQSGNSGGYPIFQVEAKIGGALYNQPNATKGWFNYDFLDGLPHTPMANGGGYTLRSALANGLTQYKVTITENLQGNINFIFQLIGGVVKPNFVLSGYRQGPIFSMINTPTYTVIANPYQFSVIDEANKVDFPGSATSGGNSIFACAPFVDPVKLSTLSITAFVVGPGVFKNNLNWAANGVVSAVAINGDYNIYNPTQFNGSPNTPMLGCSGKLFPFDQPLLTANKKPIIENAYIFAAADKNTEAQCVGKIWDAVRFTQSSEQYGIGLEVYNSVIPGRLMHNVSTQRNAIQGSLWFQVG